MDKIALATEIRRRAERWADEAEQLGTTSTEDGETIELLRCLARMIEGKAVEKAFGAPGDWGYGTPIGDALAGRTNGQTENHDHDHHNAAE